MRTCLLPNVQGGGDRYTCYTETEFPYWTLTKKAVRKQHGKKRIQYLTNVTAFDIETTTIEKYSADGENQSYAYMYHWQLCIDGKCCYGRTWKEWESFLKKLSEHLELSQDRILPIYVHNLGFEYQHMKSFLRRSFGELSVFAPQPRKPLRVSTATGLEFRCSWKLSNMTLEKFALNEKGVQHLKQAGDLDYRVRRTPSTRLTDKEFAYCIGDVVSLYEAVSCRMRNEGDDQESIPMTSTGYVRRDCRRSARADKNYRKMFRSMALTEEVYRLLKAAARGGDTHANRLITGKLIHDADSYDVQSSYPAMMMLRKFPMSRFQPYGQPESLAEFESVLEGNACLFTATLIGVRQKRFNMSPYIPEAKCEKLAKPLRDNGRILEAEGLRMTVTDVDWRIIKSQYEWDELYIDDLHIADYGWLPDAILNVVMDYFRKKTELKSYLKRKDITPEERANAEYLYGKSKNRLNGIFGMCFTDPVHDLITEEEDGSWKQRRPEDIAAALEKYNSSRNSFLIYAWGVWVTAHAREHLFQLVDAAGQHNAAYCDTDSTKGADLDSGAIEECNRQIEEECLERGAYADDGEGRRYFLGVYECETEEGAYSDFVTLGAKKYAYRDAEGLHITVSGVNKKKGAAELSDIRNFAPGFIFREAGGLEMCYQKADIHDITAADGTVIETADSIAMLDSTYTLGLPRDYAELLADIGTITDYVPIVNRTKKERKKKQ